MNFVKESRIAASPAQVFAFHESPGALSKLIPPGVKVEVVEGGHSIRPGSRVVLKTRIGLFPIRWVAEHTEYEPGRMFADRMVEGPFQSWYHRHWCLDDGEGGTLLRDEVEYEPPGGWIGRLAGDDLIQRKLGEMFDFRHQMTRRIVEAGDFEGAEAKTAPASPDDVQHAPSNG